MWAVAIMTAVKRKAKLAKLSTTRRRSKERFSNYTRVVSYRPASVINTIKTNTCLLIKVESQNRGYTYRVLDEEIVKCTHHLWDSVEGQWGSEGTSNTRVVGEEGSIYEGGEGERREL